MFKKLYLPVGLVVAMAAAVICPEPGTVLRQTSLISILVGVIFLINGYQVRLDNIPLNAKFAGAFLCVLAVSLFLSPFLGMGAARLFGLSAALSLGLIVMASVPPTLSSGIVITGVAGGDVLWALILTIGLNMLGVFIIPFLLGFTLNTGEGIVISPLPLLKKLIIMVLVPFLAGGGIKRLLKRPLPKPVTFIPSTCVILTVWMALSASHGTLRTTGAGMFVKVAAAGLSVHLVLMGVCMAGGYLLKAGRPQRIALQFVGSQKTLPVAISVLAALNPAGMGTALIAAITFHFGQLVLDSFIAARIQR